MKARDYLRVLLPAWLSSTKLELEIEPGHVTSLHKVSKVSLESQADTETLCRVKIRVILEYSVPA